MLDSECMMLDDQGVNDEWIVRVQGTEYGPANIETLREWKAGDDCSRPMKRAKPTSIFGQRQRKSLGSSVRRRRCLLPVLSRNRLCNSRAAPLLKF